MELAAIQSKIHLIRGVRVMLDFDLAVLYGIATKNLKKAVRRNPARFPDDFMFELTEEELESLRFQFGTSNRGGIRYVPFAFSEHGVAMLSTVLNSDRAIEVNIAIIRAFISMRHLIFSFEELTERMKSQGQSLVEIEEVLRWLGTENQARADEISALQTAATAPQPSRRPIGFIV